MDNEWVERLIVAGIVLLLAVIAARIADRAIARHFELRPETLTVYRVLRRSVFAVIIGVGVLSALLVIPSIRAVAYGALTHSVPPFQRGSADADHSGEGSVAPSVSPVHPPIRQRRPARFAGWVRAPPRSLAATWGILSVPRGTEMFQFPRCPPA